MDTGRYRASGGLRQLLKGVGLLLSFAATMFGPTHAAESVCAQVKIEIQQELTLERQGFDAMMRINNGLDTLAIEDVKVSVQFGDEKRANRVRSFIVHVNRW